MIVIVLLMTGCVVNGLRDDQARYALPVGAAGVAAQARGVVGASVTSPGATPVGQLPSVSVRRALEPADLTFLGVDVSHKELWAKASTQDFKPKTPLSERDSLVVFLARNERLKAAWSTRQSASHRHSQALHLRRMLEQFDALSQRPDQRPAPTIPSSESLQGKVVDAEVALARIRFETTAFELLTGLTRAFHEARYERQAVGVFSESVALSRRLVEVARARYVADKVSTADVLRAEMRLEALKRRLKTAKERRAAAVRVVGALLNVTQTIKPGSPRPRAKLPELKRLRAEVAIGGLDVRLAAVRLGRGEAMLALAERRILPDLSQGLSDRRGEQGRDRFRAGYAAGQPYLEELRDRVAAAGRALAQARTLVPAAAERAHATLSDALRRVRLYKKSQMPRARQALKTTEAEYKVGRQSFLELDDAQRLWLETHLEYHAAVRDAHIAAAELARIRGPKIVDGDKP